MSPEEPLRASNVVRIFSNVLGFTMSLERILLVKI